MNARTCLLAGAALALALLGASSCSKDKTGGGGDGEAVKPSHSYQMRGVVRGVRMDRDKTTLSIQHESVPDWVNRQGQTVGMMSMTMEFQAGPKLDVGGVKTGDKIAFAIDVYYGEGSRMEITKIDKLPADTALEIAGDQ